MSDPDATKTRLLLIRPVRHCDDRGWFSETYVADRLLAAGVTCSFPQENQSWSRAAGTMRGLHFQRLPSSQAKLISCPVGRILDCVVDIRVGSPTFGCSTVVELGGAGEQLFVPVGFAHGFMTLEPNTLISYKVSHAYDPSAEDGLLWNDPALAIDWPLRADGPILSPKDAALPLLSELDSPFEYDGSPMSLLRL